MRTIVLSIFIDFPNGKERRHIGYIDNNHYERLEMKDTEFKFPLFPIYKTKIWKCYRIKINT